LFGVVVIIICLGAAFSGRRWKPSFFLPLK
jgi:hypothetical protein